MITCIIESGLIADGRIGAHIADNGFGMNRDIIAEDLKIGVGLTLDYITEWFVQEFTSKHDEVLGNKRALPFHGYDNSEDKRQRTDEYGKVLHNS